MGLIFVKVLELTQHHIPFVSDSRSMRVNRLGHEAPCTRWRGAYTPHEMYTYLYFCLKKHSLTRTYKSTTL